MIAAPGVPALASPANGTLNEQLSCSLSWNSTVRATSYEVEVSTSNIFGTTFFDQTGTSVTSTTLSVSYKQHDLLLASECVEC